MYIHNNIQKIRRGLGMTQKDFADAIGSNYPTICLLEQGKIQSTKSINSRKLEQVANRPLQEIFYFEHDLQ